MNTDTKPYYTFKRSLTTCLAPALVIPATAAAMEMYSDDVTAAALMLYTCTLGLLKHPLAPGIINLCLATAAVYLFCCIFKFKTKNKDARQATGMAVFVPYISLSVYLSTLITTPGSDTTGHMLIWFSLIPATAGVIFLFCGALCFLFTSKDHSFQTMYDALNPAQEKQDPQ